MSGISSCYAVPIPPHARLHNQPPHETRAELTDRTPRYISKIDHGSGNVALDTIELLAEALNVRYQDLFVTKTKEISIKRVNMKKEKIG